MNSPKKVLLAGVGNELRQDDAFGIALIKQLEQLPWPPNVKPMEVGIGGIHLVQELHEGYDILILADAVDYGDIPGQLYLKELQEIGDLGEMSTDERRTFLADMHYTNPIRALMLAKALEVMPNQVMILGCQSKDHDDFAIGMSQEVKDALPKALELVLDWMKNHKILPESKS